jgi:hypothetical protein
MKITKEELQHIIKEEIQLVLKEESMDVKGGNIAMEEDALLTCIRNLAEIHGNPGAIQQTLQLAEHLKYWYNNEGGYSAAMGGGGMKWRESGEPLKNVRYPEPQYLKVTYNQGDEETERVAAFLDEFTEHRGQEYGCVIHALNDLFAAYELSPRQGGHWEDKIIRGFERKLESGKEGVFANL